MNPRFLLTQTPYPEDSFPSLQELQRRVEALAARIPHATVMPQRAQRNLGVCFERTREVAAVNAHREGIF